MAFRDDREAIEAKLRATENELESLRKQVDEQRASAEAAPHAIAHESRSRAAVAEQGQAHTSRKRYDVGADLDGPDAALRFLPWWVDLVVYGALVVLAIVVGIRECGAW